MYLKWNTNINWVLEFVTWFDARTKTYQMNYYTYLHALKYFKT